MKDDKYATAAIRAIPTIYRDVQYRSRLEARWAAFFDLIDWPARYEAIDLAGYIPDFIVTFPRGPMLIEVKPAMAPDELLRRQDGILGSSWEHEAILVGSWPFLRQRGSWDEDVQLGIFVREMWSMDEQQADDAHRWADAAMLVTCRTCGQFSLSAESASYECRVCGVNDGGNHREMTIAQQVESMWRQAGNLTQWRRPSG